MATGRRAWTGPLAVLLVVVGVAVAASGAREHGLHLGGGYRAAPDRFPVLGRSRPVQITIRSLNVRARVQEVGFADDGSIAVPDIRRADEAAWFDASPTPGQYGPAVLVGHVDTRTGPAVFYGLVKLRPGARIEIARQDRSVAVFEVNSVERFNKAHLPTKRIYADFTRPALRLITCGGAWKGGSIGYADNIVVFASLVASRRR